MELKSIETQTAKEELANSLTHGFGAIISFILLIYLFKLGWASGELARIFSYTIFGFSLVLLYSASTLYHAVTSEGAKRRLLVLDHAGIYILIAGTYTPFTLINFEGLLGWVYFIIIWVLATIGVVLKFFYAGRFVLLSTITYILMGWLAVFAVEPILTYIPAMGVALLLAGGLSYTAGTWFFSNDKKYEYYHAIWHLFVLAGSGFHTLAVVFYTIRPS